MHFAISLVAMGKTWVCHVISTYLCAGMSNVAGGHFEASEPLLYAIVTAMCSASVAVHLSFSLVAMGTTWV